jgi:hypothetical protein
VVYAHPGIPAATTILLMVFPRAVNFPANFAGSYGKCLTNPSATKTYTVYKNTSTEVGTVQISTSGTFTFATTSGAAKSFAVSDYLTIATPSPIDSTLADVAMTFAGTL